jgi:hypothetical protein
VPDPEAVTLSGVIDVPEHTVVLAVILELILVFALVVIEPVLVIILQPPVNVIV